MQRHMDHFRDARLLRDDEVILEGVEGYLGYREKSGHRKEWHGFFLIGAEYHLDPELKYTLVLPDGSTATIRGSDISACEADGGQRHGVEFYVIGEFRTSGGRVCLPLHAGKRSLAH